ncbi:MAG: heme-copper oxidase subunit III [Cytophagaceae bacterium]
MTANMPYQEEGNKPEAIHPKKFNLILFIVSIVMIFAAMTSAYIVKKSDGGWLDIKLPLTLYISTALILVSSVTIQWSYAQAKKDNLENVKWGLLLTSLLGLGFLASQLIAWDQLVNIGVVFGGQKSNPAGSFLYVLTGLHGFHLITGLIFLFIVLFSAFTYKVHSKKLLQLEMCVTYWHFLDGLWIYLFVFLLLNH